MNTTTKQTETLRVRKLATTFPEIWGDADQFVVEGVLFVDGREVARRPMDRFVDREAAVAYAGRLAAAHPAYWRLAVEC